MKTRIVIADDEVIIRADIRERLELEGYEVVGEAGDGFDAVDMCREIKPDIVLLDIKMPMMDGITAAKLIHKENPDIGIIMLTAYSDKDFVEKAAECGAMGYIVKPVEDRALFPAIEIAVNRCREIEGIKSRLDAAEQKLSERRVIEKAKGVLIKRNNMSEKEAYEYIRNVSMNKRKTMKDIAEIILINQKNIFE